MRFGYFLSCEEYTPAQLIEQARLAEESGFEALWISDHFHPWNDAQGQSPFVWSIIGGIAQVCHLPVTTAVTCPTLRTHPVIIAQAAATSAVMLDGRFTLGVGSGEALNEHILGTVWPTTDIRLEMLAESVHLMRRLWTEDFVSARGRHYTVDTARIYTRPEVPPPVYMSGFGPEATDLGAETEDEGVGIAHRLWANGGLPGELAQVLPSPRHCEQASTLVPEDTTRQSVACGPAPKAHLQAFEPYLSVGFDELYVANMGPHYRQLMDLYRTDVLPALRDRMRS